MSESNLERDKFPYIYSEWDYTLNDKCPEDYSAHSDAYAWWICPKGHSYRARISNRTSKRHTGCPYCAGQKVLVGFNDLVSNFPQVADEWNYQKNNGLLPQQITARSNKTVWWICKNGHEWQACINNRTTFGNKCPYCMGKLPIAGETDLATLLPTVAEQWHPTKNGELKPSNVTASSNKYAWWRCQKGHEWRTKIYHRSEGRGCPYCAGQKVLAGFNDLMTVNPLLADEWDYELNYPCTPSEVTSCSHRMSYWKCKFGHSWKTRVIDRNNGKGCPICAGRRIISGINDLKSLFPDIAKEWHPTKNGDREPSSVAAHSNAYAWWLCEQGHEWHAQIKNRTNGTGCPYCNQNRMIPEKTSLAVINPVLAMQWHNDKNGDRTPWNTSAFCNDKFWWKCEKGHEWEATVSSRSYGKGCPYCSGRNTIKGETDLTAIIPELASQWNYEKNNQLQPNGMSVHSNKKVWWKCENGHEWRATIASRSNGCGCPICLGRRPMHPKLI